MGNQPLQTSKMGKTNAIYIERRHRRIIGQRGEVLK